MFNIYANGLDKKKDNKSGAVIDAPSIMVWPGASKEAAIGEPALQKILKEHIVIDENNQEMVKKKEQFLSTRVMRYSQLRSSDHFATLVKAIKDKTDENKEKEVGRLVYLSVPPSFYGGLARDIHAHLRPNDKNSSWLKVIVEKPFGMDFNSASTLANELFKTLQESEILLVDHYMGKPSLAAIREFRNLNPEYEKLLTNENVKSIEVAMVETEDVAGRTSFYEEVGVVRDTMQNHLMMMVSLLTMDINDGDSEAQNRKEVVEKIKPASIDNVIIAAQYDEYNQHVNDDREKWKQPKLETPSTTATFAKVNLFIDHPRWSGIPITFTSGKALPSRRAFTHVIFKNGEELIINVQGKLKDASDAAIKVTPGLPPFIAPKGWKVIESVNETHVRYAKSPSTMNAYEVLIRDALEGRIESFVRLPEVLESWRVWTPLIEQLPNKPLYKYGKGGVNLPDPSNSCNAPQQ